MGITEVELGWLAGILEGEGCFDYQSSNSARIRVSMTDEDTVLRIALIFQKITGKAHDVKCYQPKGTLPKRKEWQLAFAVAAYSKDAQKIMKLVVRLMSARRRKRIWQALNGHRESIVKQKLDLKLIVSNAIQHLKTA